MEIVNFIERIYRPEDTDIPYLWNLEDTTLETFQLSK